MRGFRPVSIVAAAALATSACASTQAQGEARPSVTESIVLPAGADVVEGDGVEVRVKLIDQTASDKVIGSQAIIRPSDFPAEFVVQYDPSDLVSGHTYAIEASIEVFGDTKYKSAIPVPVLTEGNPTTVQVQTEATQ